MDDSDEEERMANRSRFLRRRDRRRVVDPGARPAVHCASSASAGDTSTILPHNLQPAQMAPKASQSKVAPSSQSSATTSAVQSLWTAYLDNTSSRLKFIDCFLVFLILSGVIQFTYCVLVTSFPFNAFLAGYAYILIGLACDSLTRRLCT